jgi:hypothetical protein
MENLKSRVQNFGLLLCDTKCNEVMGINGIGKMKIILAEHFGMCFGVRDAITQAEQLAQEAPLTVLGNSCTTQSCVSDSGRKASPKARWSRRDQNRPAS